jgi:parallel beta-helix repeat protein
MADKLMKSFNERLRKFGSLTCTLQLVLGMLIFSGIMFTQNAAGTVPPPYIDSETTWTLAGSPYYIEYDVTVNSTANLTIDPGVQVKFNGPYSLIIDGDLIAIGTQADNIIFTSNYSIPSPGNWQSIRFNKWQNLYQYTSTIKYATIEYSQYGVYCNNRSVAVENSTVIANVIGIYSNLTSFPFISNNTITYNTKNGIDWSNDCLTCDLFIWQHMDNRILNNTISNNNDKGVNLSYYAYPIIKDNHIYSNGYGIRLEDSISWIFDNNISANTYGIYSIDSAPMIGNDTVQGNNIIKYNAEQGIHLAGNPPIVFGSSYAHVAGNEYISHNGDNGILVLNTNNVSIHKNTISYNGNVYNQTANNSNIYAINNTNLTIKDNNITASEDLIIAVNTTANISGNYLYGSMIFYSSYPENITSAILAIGSTLNISNNNITEFDYGISLMDNSYADVFNNTIELDTAYAFRGVLSVNSNSTISYNNFTDNGIGIILLNNSYSKAHNNTFNGTGLFSLRTNEHPAAILCEDSSGEIDWNDMFLPESGSGSWPSLNASNCNLDIENNTMVAKIMIPSSLGYGKGIFAGGGESRIFNNLIGDAGISIWLDNTISIVKNNNITEMNSVYGMYTGIYANNSEFLIYNNSITDDVWGIDIRDSQNSSIERNGIVGPVGGAYVGIYIIDSNNITIKDNNVTSFLWENIYLYNATDIKITGNNVSSCSGGGCIGIELRYSSTVEIENNTIGDNVYGIIIYYSSNAFVGYNKIENNTNYGIHIATNCYATLRNNTVKNNLYGLHLTVTNNEPEDTYIINNTISDNYYGIYFPSGMGMYPYAYIEGNNIEGNSVYGAYVYYGKTYPYAEQNWWGHYTGPYDPSDDTASGGYYNPNGQGDDVTDYINYWDWQLSPAF